MFEQPGQVAAQLAIGKEIADHENRCRAFEMAGAASQLGALTARLGPKVLQPLGDGREVMLSTSTRTLGEHAVAEDEQPDAMPDLQQGVAHRCRDGQRGLPFGRTMNGHRRAGVEQQRPVGNRLRFEAAQDRPQPTCGLAPVDVPHLVAGQVVAMVEMLDADAGASPDGARALGARQPLDQQLRRGVGKGLQLGRRRQHRRL